MKKIHDDNKLQKVVIYCGNREFHKLWAKEYAKIILVTDKFPEVMNLLKWKLLKKNEKAKNFIILRQKHNIYIYI